jgi:hypothetical protein
MKYCKNIIRQSRQRSGLAVDGASGRAASVDMAVIVTDPASILDFRFWILDWRLRAENPY